MRTTLLDRVLALMERWPDRWAADLYDLLARLPKTAQDPLDEQRAEGAGESAEERADDVVSTILFLLIVRAHQFRLALRLVVFALGGLLLLGLLK